MSDLCAVRIDPHLPQSMLLTLSPLKKRGFRRTSCADDFEILHPCLVSYSPVTFPCSSDPTSRDNNNSLIAHDCGYPLSRYTCRATRVAADFLDFIAFCRCSTGVALHPLKFLVSHLPPPCARRCRTEIWV